MTPEIADRIALVPAGLHAWDSAKGRFWCWKCSVEYTHDPALEVQCTHSSCGAAPGQACRRPSGHSGPFVGTHAERDQGAIDSGVIPMPCTGASSVVTPVNVSKRSAQWQQTDLFAQLVG